MAGELERVALVDSPSALGKAGGGRAAPLKLRKGALMREDPYYAADRKLAAAERRLIAAQPQNARQARARLQALHDVRYEREQLAKQAPKVPMSTTGNTPAAGATRMLLHWRLCGTRCRPR